MQIDEQWPEIKTLQSSDQNVLKLVFTKPDAAVEAVLYKYPTYLDRTVICCSTQSGCPMGCRFCGAGDSFVRSLRAEEIVAQVEHCLALTGVNPLHVQKLQIMCMAMGEPLLNKQLGLAFTELHQKYPNARLLISTSAPDVDYEWAFKLAEQIPTVGLQFSVHESTDTARDKLIPFKKKLNLEQIAARGEAFFARTGRSPFFNYCAHSENTSQADVDRLLSYFNPNIWSATVSVICERDESIQAANERQRKLATDFMEKLLLAGYDTRCFDPAGQDDIGGGCGQLPHYQRWIAENPDKARPSIGHGMEVVHTPQKLWADKIDCVAIDE